MTDMELAEEIGKACTEARADMFVSWLLERLIQDPFARPKVKQDATTALAALRRGPEREGFYEKLWKDFVSLQRGDAQDIIAKVEAYYSERPPSGEMVMVPMAVVEALSDLTELKKIKRLIEKGEATDEQCRYYEGRKEYSWRFAEQAIENARAMLSTEASKEAK